MIVVNEWDPIGFFPMAPKDEYINEIKKIIDYLNKNQDVSEEKLTKKINEIFIQSFGSDVYVEDIDGCLKVAKGILNWYRKNHMNQ